MSDRRSEKQSAGGGPEKHGPGTKVIHWLLGGGALGLVLLLLELMQAPQTVASFHEWMCGWARDPAGWFGDCAAYAAKSSQTVAAGTSDPLELLTRRGYTADHRSMYRAFSLGRKEDVELHRKVGVKMSLIFAEVPVSQENWQYLVSIGAVDEPCDFNETDLQTAESLLDGALRKGNLAIYKNLCSGKYVQSIAAAAAKAKSDHARRVGEAQAADATVNAAADRAMSFCKASIGAAIPETLLKDYAYCKIVVIKTEEQRAKWSSGCAAVEPAERALKALEIKLREMGFQWAPPNPNYDCVEQRSCANSVGGDLAEKYFFFVMKAEQPDLERWRKTYREPQIAKACEELRREDMSPAFKRARVPAQSGASFYEKFEQAIASRKR